jgi:hypothetical protein
MNDQFKKPVRRTQAYWYVDGLAELGTGILFLFLGIVLWIEGSAPKGSTFAGTMSTLRQILLIGGMIGVSLLVKAIKTRLTYPRTGYIAYPQPKGKQLVRILGLGIGITALTGFVVVLLFWWVPALQELLIYLPTWLVIGWGIFISGMFISWALRSGLRRFYGLAALAFLTGLVLGWYSRGLNIVEGRNYLFTGPGIFFAVIGIGLCFSGALTLRDYLQKTQPLGGETQ